MTPLVIAKAAQPTTPSQATHAIEARTLRPYCPGSALPCQTHFAGGVYWRCVARSRGRRNAVCAAPNPRRFPSSLSTPDSSG